MQRFEHKGLPVQSASLRLSKGVARRGAKTFCNPRKLAFLIELVRSTSKKGCACLSKNRLQGCQDIVKFGERLLVQPASQILYSKAIYKLTVGS